RVDAGTIELVRSFGVEPVTSAELVQRFEAVFSPAQHQMHVEASDKMHRIIQEAFAEIARRHRANEPTTEWDIAQFMLRRYSEEGMQQEPMIVAVNANTANPHYMPTKEKNSPIKRGDFVLIDAATKLNKPDAVATDQTWTGYVRESVPEEYTRIFNIENTCVLFGNTFAHITSPGLVGRDCIGFVQFRSRIDQHKIAAFNR